MSENMRFTERDRKILLVLDKLGFAYASDLMILCGFTGIVACRRRLYILAKNKYLKIDKVEDKNAYTLAYKGYMEIEKINAKQLEKNMATRHMLLMGSVIAFLSFSQGITLDQIKSDRELRAARPLGEGKRAHIPDAVVFHDGIKHAFELELTAKDPERLKRNILANAQKYDHQRWIVPDSRKKIRKNIIKISKDLLLENKVSIYSLDQIIEILKNEMEKKEEAKDD